MNAFLAEIIAADRSAQLRQEADNARLVAAAGRQPSDAKGAVRHPRRPTFIVRAAAAIWRRPAAAT